jgi:hypothetical protein
MKLPHSAVMDCLVALLPVACAATSPPIVAKGTADCEAASACEVRGLLEMGNDGHGYIGTVRLDDGSCINVSLPERQSRSIQGQPPRRMSLIGKVVPFPYGEDVLSFKVNGRKVGYGRCGSYFVFVR